MPNALTDPGTLLAIARAAQRTGDQALERAARRLLREDHGIDVTFRRPASVKLSLAHTDENGQGGSDGE